jgi:hypothetical protein
MELKESQKWMLVLAHAMTDAWSRPNLKTDLIENPRKALRFYYRYKLPPHIKVIFDETDKGGCHDYSKEDFRAFDNPDEEARTFNITLYIPFGIGDFSRNLEDDSADPIQCMCCCL